MAAIQEFFVHKQLYATVNYVIVTLIPQNPIGKEYEMLRPIACCTTIYKIISKVLTTRLGRVINEIVGNNHSAFLLGRVIHVNILMAHELLRGYNRKYISPRCPIQMDTHKAYETVEWPALEIQRCLNTLKKKPDFNFHPRCEKFHITNISFLDDLILFNRGYITSINILLGEFKKFSQATGLVAHPTKCKLYFGGVQVKDKQDIMLVIRFLEGDYLSNTWEFPSQAGNSPYKNVDH
ncbi:uncharacterized protein LOC131597033 [Vicia villosa]|uniref:uncharacterized protein LOC131597033 n=1 Tax=Vicia villosa TaxID=3911 RepID=UPI00273A88BC|nr:uncharacterized protein LOC131597033 [Vicia villosa]